MEISGKVQAILPLQTGQGKNGPWKKQEFILEMPGQYPKKVCITIWGEKIDQYNLSTGDQVTASVDIESREFNGRWYTDVKAWKVTKGGSTQENTGGSFAPNTDPHEQGGNDEDIPF
ncbi:MAG: DUF3127 domain-containing protein [Cyclobacteriaceae bacterium]